MRRAREFGRLDVESLARVGLHKMAQRVGIAVGRFPSVDSLQGHLKAFFHQTGVNCVLDVGAHKGEFRDSLLEIGFRGRVVSFEPVGVNYDAIARRARGDDRWMVRKQALGAAAGSKQINIYRGTVFNSFLTPSGYAASRFGGAVEQERTESVEVVRLDQVFAECVAGIANPKVFLKMDTQGWDIEVLSGASGILEQLVGMQSELSVQHCYEGMPSYTQALDHYTSLGFDVTGLFPVTRDKDNLRVVEFDCVMCRQTRVPSPAP